MNLEQARKRSTRREAGVGNPIGAGTILVVDDYASLAEIVAKALDRSGFHVLTATCGKEAQNVARVTPRIDLLVTDLEMPGMRGDELARWLPTVHPNARVVLMSSSPKALRGSFSHHFVTKPFRIEELVAKVRDVLDEQSGPAANVNL